MGKTENQRWYGGMAPWERSEDDFVALHRTGFISGSAYEEYGKEGGLSWLGKKETYPIIQRTDGGIDYRRTGSQLKYVKTDEAGEVVRGPDGLATYLTDTEVKQRGYATHDQTIVAFAGDEPIGLVSNEFGAVGVWVEERFQRRGIGVSLLKMFLTENPTMRIGQMTELGVNTVRRLHQSFVADNLVPATPHKRSRRPC